MPEMNSIQLNKSIYSLLVSQLYNDVRFKFQRNIFKKESLVPWMRYREIELIVDLLKNLKPKNCLEWGTGTGTQFFTNFISTDSKWISIEHNKDWAITVIEQNKKHNVEIVLKEPNHEPIPGLYSGHLDASIHDGPYEDFKDYIEYPEVKAPFDFILIDGRARVPCLIKAKDMLSDDGIVMLHDANRRFYHEGFRHYEKSILFSDQRQTSGGIWIGTNGKKSLTSILDTEAYTKLWRLYDRIGKVIKV